MTGPTRRCFVFGAAATATALFAPGARAALRREGARRISFRNLHTNEALAVPYRVGGEYVPDSLSALDHLLRDFRTGDVAHIDPGLYDLLHALQRRLGHHGELLVISGYRSPATNAMLAARSGGVAKHSLHMLGEAIDIRVPGRAPRTVFDAARSLRRGGVGLYTASNFVHVDTGRVRVWGR